MQYSDEILAKWRAGEIEELALYCNDAAECEGTFFKWIDAGVGYDYPSFYCGNEKVFDKYQRLLIEHSQANRS